MKDDDGKKIWQERDQPEGAMSYQIKGATEAEGIIYRGGGKVTHFFNNINSAIGVKLVVCLVILETSCKSRFVQKKAYFW